MRTAQDEGRQRFPAARRGATAPATQAPGSRCPGVQSVLALVLLLGASACTVTRPTDGALMDNIAEMQIRMRLLQSELDAVRDTLAAQNADQSGRVATDAMLNARFDELQTSLAAIPEEIAQRCPETLDGAAASTQCTTVQRVVVSDDKLVVGQLERVWLEQPALSLIAAVDAGAETSLLRVNGVVEFERDGNKWVRFEMPSADEPVTVERPLERTGRANGDNGPRLPVVELRIQIGDVRESVEFLVAEREEEQLQDDERLMTLGRNFLTDVALVDVARTYVQPAFTPPAD